MGDVRFVNYQITQVSRVMHKERGKFWYRSPDPSASLLEKQLSIILRFSSSNFSARLMVVLGTPAAPGEKRPAEVAPDPFC